MDFGAGDLGITAIANQIGTFKLQDWDYKKSADKDEVRDVNGNMQTITYYNPNQEATFSYFISGTGLANALTQTIIPDIGILCVVTSTNYTTIAGTNWIVEDSQLKATNTKNKMVTLKLRRYPGITAVASA